MSFFAHESAIVDKGAKIGVGCKIWHFSHIMTNTSIGCECSLGQNTFIADGVVIGNRVKIQNNVSVYSGVIIEEDCFIGPSVVFTNVKFPRSSYPQKDNYKKTKVCKGASIGANAVIIAPCIIGEYSFIGAGSVVTKDVQPYTVVVGNPAKVIYDVDEKGNIKS